MKRNSSETMKEAKQEKPITAAKGCSEKSVGEQAAAVSGEPGAKTEQLDAAHPEEELSDDEIEGVAGGISIIIPN